MENISQRIKRFRTEQGLSVREVALRAKVPVSTYREWEGGRQIKGEPYENIARALNVTLYELLTGEKPKITELLEKIQVIEHHCALLKKALESVGS